MAYTTMKTWSSEVLTAADMLTYLTNNINHLRANIELDAPTELTIAAGEVTKTKSYHYIDTQADAATDDLDTINGGTDGCVLFLQAAHTDRTVVLKNGTGNLDIGGDIHLDTAHKVVALLYHADGSAWHLINDISKTREWPVNGFSFPAPGTDWTPSLLGATLAQNKAAKILWIPLHGFIIGDAIVSYKLVGDAVEAAALTLDCKLVRVNKADPITSSDIAGGAITQIDADGNFDSEAVLTAPEVIATDKQYILQITGTTGVGDSFTVMGAEIKTTSLS